MPPFLSVLPRRPAWLTPSWLIFLGALGVRLLVLFRGTAARDFLPDHGDMEFYDAWAQRIASGAWTDGHAFYGMPLYAYALAALYRVFGHCPYAAVWLQTIVEAGTAVCLYQIALLAFSRRRGRVEHEDAQQQSVHASVETMGDERKAQLIGILAAVGWTFFMPAQAFSIIIMPTALFVGAFWWLVWWLLRDANSAVPRPLVYLWVGCGVGVAAMMVANILFLVPLLAIALLIRATTAAGEAPGASGGRLRLRALASIAALMVGIGFGTAPCWLHNYVVARDPVLLSAHSGLNFWMGNNPNANGYPRVPPTFHADQQGLLRDSITWAERAAGRPLKRAEVSAYWSAQARDYISAHPVEWLQLLATKVRNFWSGFQYDDLTIIASLREDGVLTPGLTFGWVAAFGLPGLLLAVVRQPRARWIAAAVVVHMLSLLPVFITERYRLAAVPGLLLLAAFGLVEAGRALAHRRVATVTVYLALIAAATTLALWPQRDISLLALEDYNTGLADLQHGNLARAQIKLERVYQRAPDNAENAFALGNLQLALGDRARAKQFYRRAGELDPSHSRVFNNLGVLALDEHRWALAGQFLTRAIQLNPDDAKTFFLLARAHQGLGQFDDARVAIAHALQLDPARTDFVALRDELARPAPVAGTVVPAGN